MSRPGGGDDGGRRFARGAVISGEFAPRRDDAVVVNRATGSTRCVPHASACAALLPPGLLLLEDPSDLLSDTRETTKLVAGTQR